MTDTPKVKAQDLRWDDVKKAAETLVKLADDAIYWKAPEERGIRLPEAADEVNRIAEALCLVPRRGNDDS